MKIQYMLDKSLRLIKKKEKMTHNYMKISCSSLNTVRKIQEIILFF